MEQLNITLFGPLQIFLDNELVSDFRTKKVVALLVYLAAEPERAHRRETLMTLLWPGMPETSARANLRQVLFRLKQAMSDFVVEDTAVPLLITNRHTIQINRAAPVLVDSVQFESLLSQTRSHDHVDLLTCHTCRSNLVAAATLYTGHFLADFYLEDSNEFEEWAEIRRQGTMRKALDAMDILTTIAMRQQAYAEARMLAERQLEIDDLRESAYQQLMEISARNGQRNEALAVYEKCRRHLMEELGMAPAKRTTTLYEQILAGDLRFDSVQEQGARGYELQDEIGAGAYGVIHRAIQPAIGREVAVKVIRRRYANDPSFIRRFEAEAQTIARLEHPHIVPLYDYWRDPEGAYLVMRLLRGGNLLTALADGPWPVDRTQKLLDQITPALAAAHHHGVVHRDIKPANILFDKSDNAYLSDFGIAKDLHSDRQFTMEAGIMGTPDYISPEQLLEERVSPQSDIYSLGAVLYEMLTGEKPFPDAPMATVIQNHLSTPFPLVSESRPDVPSQIDEVIQQATAKRPSDRYANVMEMAAAFRSAVQGISGEPAAPAVTPVVEPLYNPYKGLRSFQEADADDFYGREGLVEQLIAGVADSRFLAVVGPSGSGKSSAVKAGLIPALRKGVIPSRDDQARSDKWFVTEMTPGSHPLEELELALWPIAVDPPPSLVEPMRHDTRGLSRTIRRILPNEEGAQLLLVIDQFEELFTLVDDEERRAFFIDSLLTAIRDPRSPLRVVITLRADFYDRPLQMQSLGKLLKENTAIVLPMPAADLTWAIREPARRMGVRLEPGLAEAIVADISDQPGGLPLLQFALTELFEQRQDGQMTRASYEKIGGATGALGRRADEIYDELDEAGQEATRQLFMRLVTLGEGVEDTRRRVLRSEIESVDDSQQSVVDEFGQARLLTFDHDPVTREPTVEVAHEALLREWRHLRSWLDESRSDVRTLRLLSLAANDWQGGGRDDSYLLRGSRLELFAGWAAGSSIVMTESERQFLDASIAWRLERQTQEEGRRQEELETAQKLAATEKARAEAEEQRAEEQALAAQGFRRRSYVLGGVLVMAVLLASAAFFFAQQSSENAAEAQDNAQLAATREAEAVAEGLRADNQRDVALAAGVEADGARVAAEEQARVAFSRELAAEAVSNLAEDPQRSVLLALQALSTAHTQEAEEALHRGIPNLRLLQTMVGHEDGISDLDYSQDGSRLVSSSWDGSARVWDTATGQEVLVLGEPEETIENVAYSSDGSFIVTGGPDIDRTLDIARMWDAASGELIAAFPNDSDNPYSDWNIGMDISPDSKSVAVSDGFGRVTLWDAATLTERATFDMSETDVAHVKLAFSPDGFRLVMLGALEDDNKVIRIIEVDSGTELLSIEDVGNDFALSPDGRRLLVGDQNGRAVRLWDLDAMVEMDRYPAYATNEVGGLAFSPDGARFSSYTRDLSGVQIWETETGREIMTLPAHRGLMSNILFSPDGSSLATTGHDKFVKVWDITPARELLTVQPFIEDDWAEVTSIAFSQDGTMLAAGGIVGGVSLWDPVTGESLNMLEGHNDFVGGLSFSPTGDRLASGSDDSTVMMWDTTTGDLLFTLTDHEDWVNSLVYSPDGATIASAGNDAQSFVWDATSGEVLYQFPLPDRAWGIAYSPDGTLLATGWLGGVAVRDMASGQTVSEIDYDQNALHVYFSADGSHLITAGVDGIVRIWEVGTGQLVQEINADQQILQGSSVSPDGSIVATASNGSDVRLWDYQSGERRLILEGAGEGVTLAEFTPDGRQLVTGGFDGNVRFYVLAVDELVDLAESRLTRSLSEEECQEYLHVDACPAE